MLTSVAVIPVNVYRPKNSGAADGSEEGNKGEEKQGDKEMADDDRVAEQFRREFMEDQSRRRRRRLGPRVAPALRVKNNEFILKGPKLGGSRNARAAIRNKLLEQQIEQQKNMPPGSQPGRRRRRR